MRTKEDFNILFVDNSRTTRVAMTRVIENEGFTVETASSGQEAIEKAITGKYDLIIMDLYMPNMNGYEAAKAIRNESDPKVSKVPMIALTASADSKDMQVAQDSGMDEYIVKSKSQQELLECINHFYQTT